MIAVHDETAGGYDGELPLEIGSGGLEGEGRFLGAVGRDVEEGIDEITVDPLSQRRHPRRTTSNEEKERKFEFPFPFRTATPTDDAARTQSVDGERWRTRIDSDL